MYIVENEQKPSKSHSGYTKKIMVINKTHEKNFPVKSRIIAVWGSPSSGKTTLSVKLAQNIYSQFIAVAVVCADMTAPALPVLFPNRKADEMFSLGAALSKPEVTRSDVLNNIVTVKGKSNLGFLGFTDGENRFSYPAFDSAKADTLFSVLKSIADVVIVDCASDIQNVLTASAFQTADCIVRIVNPDLKSVSFFSSQLPLLGDPKYKRDEHIICLSRTDNTVYEPVNEAISHFGEGAFSFPFCAELKKQSMNGALLEKLSDRKYTAALKDLAEKAV